MSRTARTARLAAACLAAVTAACSDSPTAPAPSATPALARGGAPAGITYTSDGLVRIANAEGGLVAGAWVTFFNLQTGIGPTVQDNASGDLDLRPGYVRARTYSGQATNKLRAAVSYAPAPYSTSGARVELTAGGPLVDFGTITLKRMPNVVATFKSTDGRLLGGGGVKIVRSKDGSELTTVDDNSAKDADPTVGRIKAYFDSDQMVTIMENKFPVGFQAPSIYMAVATVPYGGTTSVTWVHEQFVY